MIELFYMTYRWDLTGTITPGQSRPGSNANEGVLTLIPEAPDHLHQMMFSVIPGTLFARLNLTSQWSCEGAVGLFNNFSWECIVPNHTRFYCIILYET